MQIWELFIVLRHPVAISIKVTGKFVIELRFQNAIVIGDDDEVAQRLRPNSQ